jgi:predicted KAP-like P-loop ATPase
MQGENITNNDASPNSKINRIKIITDEPILEDDAVDFVNYGEKLAEIIRNSTPRFSIGIFGGWGTGKTTLMSMIRKNLESDEKIVTVWFDAWRYEKEEDLAVIPFLRTVSLTIDKSKAVDWDLVKNGIRRTAIAFLKSTKVTYGIKDVASAEIDFGKALIGDGSVGNDHNSIYYHVTGFLEKALKDLRKKDEDYRIVIFIDDLDRCNPGRALEVLESIKSFFDIEGIVYVVDMDSNTIDSLVKKKYGADP